VFKKVVLFLVVVGWENTLLYIFAFFEGFGGLVVCGLLALDTHGSRPTWKLMVSRSIVVLYMKTGST
jgi:hypothetical protein